MNTVNSYENLLNIIKRFDEIPVCQGAISSNQISDVNSSYGYQFVESYGMWRHIKCCTILTRDSSVHRLLILNLIIFGTFKLSLPLTILIIVLKIN